MDIEDEKVDWNRTTTGETCDVCGEKADEIARGVYWRHPQCIRKLAAQAAAEYIRKMQDSAG